LFSSLSESGFIPTFKRRFIGFRVETGSSHLFQRVASFLHKDILNSFMTGLAEFSSLSESGFIPTNMSYVAYRISKETVLISFREWLHSYLIDELDTKYGIRVVLISFREWLHSYLNIPSREVFDSLTEFSSLSESGFIPTKSC